MAMGSRPPERQGPLLIATESLARSPGHPFYERMNALFAEEGSATSTGAVCRSA
jgi:hypothetical protein